MRLSDVDTWRLVIEEKVDMPFQIGSGHGREWHLGVC